MPGPSPLERAIEVVLTTGLALSAVLLLVGLARPSPAALQSGVLILMLTPVARVVIVTAGLIHERDWLFAAVSLWILGVLGSSLWVASQLSRAH